MISAIWLSNKNSGLERGTVGAEIVPWGVPAARALPPNPGVGLGVHLSEKGQAFRQRAKSQRSWLSKCCRELGANGCGRSELRLWLGTVLPLLCLTGHGRVVGRRQCVLANE